MEAVVIQKVLLKLFVPGMELLVVDWLQPVVHCAEILPVEKRPAMIERKMLLFRKPGAVHSFGDTYRINTFFIFWIDCLPVQQGDKPAKH